MGINSCPEMNATAPYCWEVNIAWQHQAITWANVDPQQINTLTPGQNG